MKDATVLPDRNADSVTSDGATKDGRGALEDYLSLNYITRNHSRSISRGLEYSQNDFSIWTIAKGLAKAESEQDELLERSSWWQNQWNIDANKTLDNVGDFIGFPAPRNADGTWNTTNYDPSQCTPSCGYVRAFHVMKKLSMQYPPDITNKIKAGTTTSMKPRSGRPGSLRHLTT